MSNNLKPMTTTEAYMGYLSGDFTGELPKPRTRAHHFLKKIAEKFGGSSGETKMWREIDTTEWKETLKTDNYYYEIPENVEQVLITVCSCDTSGDGGYGPITFYLYDGDSIECIGDIVTWVNYDDVYPRAGMLLRQDGHGATEFFGFGSLNGVPTSDFSSGNKNIYASVPLVGSTVKRIRIPSTAVTKLTQTVIKAYVIDK